MNDPKLAAERREAVVEAKKRDVPKHEAWSWVQNNNGRKFEGHLLKSTIENVYNE